MATTSGSPVERPRCFVKVSVAPVVVNQMPVQVIDAQLFYELAPDSYFLPPPSPLLPPPPPKATNSPSQRKRNTGPQDSSRPYIKKPPNAFMLFMKEQRPLVKTKFINKDSASVNKILGHMWKSLPLEEQEKYYVESDRLNLIHASMYPGWSCRDNYGKKKKRVWRTSPTASAPERAKAPSTYSCNRHEVTEADRTSALFTGPGPSEAADDPSSSPSGITYTQL